MLTKKRIGSVVAGELFDSIAQSDLPAHVRLGLAIVLRARLDLDSTDAHKVLDAYLWFTSPEFVEHGYAELISDYGSMRMDELFGISDQQVNDIGEILRALIQLQRMENEMDHDIVYVFEGEVTGNDILEAMLNVAKLENSDEDIVVVGSWVS